MPGFTRVLGRVTTGRKVDFGAVVRRLLTFDTVVIDEATYCEIVPLVQKFGVRNVNALLESGRIQFLTDPSRVAATTPRNLNPTGRSGIYTIGPYELHSIVNLGQEPALPSRDGKPDHDEVMAFVRESQDKRLAEVIQELKTGGIRAKDLSKLEQEVRAAVIPFDDRLPDRAMATALGEIADMAPATQRRFIASTMRQLGRDPDELIDATIEAEFLDASTFVLKTNLSKALGLPIATVAPTFQRGIFDIAGAHDCVERMGRYSALMALKPEEAYIIDERVRPFLLKPDERETTRVLEIAGFPDVDPDPAVSDVDMGALLELLNSEEARVFREWVQGRPRAGDVRILPGYQLIAPAIGRTFGSPSGKVIRIVVSEGAGFATGLPGASTAVEMGLSKLLHPGGPAVFLSRLSRSAFRGS